MFLSTCSSPLTVSDYTGELAWSGCGQGGLADGRLTSVPLLPVLYRYGAITFGNVQKSIPASFGARAPPMVRKIAVRRVAQVGCYPGVLGTWS